MNANSAAAVRGVIAAILTPFTPGGERVDLELLGRHVAWLHEQASAASPRWAPTARPRHCRSRSAGA